MSSDTLVVVGAEGVIYPLVAQGGVAGVPALIGEALAGISFSTGLSSYRKCSIKCCTIRWVSWWLWHQSRRLV